MVVFRRNILVEHNSSDSLAGLTFISDILSEYTGVILQTHCISE